MLNKMLSRLAGSPLFAASFSSEQLIELFKQLGSADPQGDLIRIDPPKHSLLRICLQLLSKDERVSDEEFVHRAYRGLLGREPDEQGFREHVANLTSGSITRVEIIDSFLHSQEFHKLFGTTHGVSDVPPHLSRRRAYVTDYLQRTLHAGRLLPPLSMRCSVGENLWDIYGEHFEITGRHFVEKLSRDAGLGPESRVLDLGCGCGRIAIPLTEVISPSGLYRGLEASEAMVNWCRRKITPRFPHFQFHHCDVRSNVYNPTGREKPEVLRFPFDEGSFDLVLATSVFTHLVPDAALNYIRECGRVLRGGGILFATAFLTESGTRSTDGALCFVHPLHGIALSIDSVFPERAVAYPTDWLLDAGRQAGLELLPPVRWGGWSGRARAYSGQDVLIFRKQR